MSAIENELLEHTIGTDSVFIFPLLTTDLEAFAAAKELDPDAPIEPHQTPTDLTGAYFYFQIFEADGTTIILNLNNDPADASVGITFRAPETGGVVEVAVANADMVDGNAGVRLPYIGFVRLGPAGAGKRYEATDGAITLEAGKVKIT